MPIDSNQQLIRNNARLLTVEGFHATMLNNDRSLHIYLPPDYYKNITKKFPVLYVQDDKSIFDISDWSKESLNMHTTADRLISQNKICEVIIVGIDMGKPVTGKGLMYEDFVINDVKPFVEKILL